MPSLILIAIIAFTAGFVIARLIVNAKRSVAEKLLMAATNDKTQLEANYQKLQSEFQQSLRELTALQAELKYKQEKLQDMEQIGERFENQFKVLANNILEDKAQKFSEQQETGLKNILEPLKQNIQLFKQEFESRYNDETKERASLIGQIKIMMELNKTLSDEANNLTQALRGQVKQQGNWGEMILERILEHTGLQKNIHYFTQQSSRNEEGNTIQPDVIIKYPDERVIVIDSKVSLVHYDNYLSAAAEDKPQQLQLLVRSVKSHIDGLGGKAYYDVKGSLDFVMMFIPVEAAYITAMQADTNLWQYAYSKRILLLSPTNLIAAMKLVQDMWQRDAINKDAYLIADRAGKLYDKLVGFVENFDKVGSQLEKAHLAWNDAYKQLSKGRGNLISQAEQMKQYKATATKSLPASLAEEALNEDGANNTEEETRL